MAKNLLTELVTLFQGQKLEVVQQAVKEATKQVWPELVTGPLSKLFDTQMETLKARGCPKAILEEFGDQRDAVLSKVDKMEIPDGHILFVPVVPRTAVDLDDLMKMVHNRDCEGYNCLDQSYISNVVEDVSNKPYLIYDVEDGKDMLGKSPEKAEKLIKKQGRTCLTVDEGIALCVHTNVLSEHYVDCTGSRYGRAGWVPSVYLSDGWPLLGWDGADGSDDGWGSASCRSRA